MNNADVAIALISGALAVLVFSIARVKLPPIPQRGSRGAVRAKERRSAAFRFAEYFLRLGAAVTASLPLADMRQRYEERLVRAGDYLGLTADEYIAMCAFTCAGGLAVGFSFSPLYGLTSAVVAVLLCTSSLASASKKRCKLIDRALPGAIDLSAMAMGAGLDFPGSVRLVADNMPARGAPLRGELERILQELSLGHTRKHALIGFSRRVPSDAVREFVNAAVQGEEKGTPLAEVLSIQASTMRGRRTVLAEEAAAKAGVMMIVPMMMLFCTVLLLVLGPLIIGMSNGAMG